MAVEKYDVHLALRLIVENCDQKSLNYCVNYAREGLNMTGHELHVQVLYVLNNMTHWRGGGGQGSTGHLEAVHQRQ